MAKEAYDDWEEGGESDGDDWSDDSDSAATTECPNCREEIYEDADQCPYCKQYVTTGSVTSNRKPLWIIITAIVCIYAMLHFYISAFFFG